MAYEFMMCFFLHQGHIALDLLVKAKILGINVEVVWNALIMNVKGPKFSHIFRSGSIL